MIKYPSEVVTLPSKGLLYPKLSPLSSGELEIKYLTALEEDILTNSNYINNGTVLDKLLESIIITPNVNVKELIVGDRDALLVYARILGYGQKYSFDYKPKGRNSEEITVDLNECSKMKDLEDSLYNDKNSFDFILPLTQKAVTIRLLTVKDEELMATELKGLKKINPNFDNKISTLLRYIITSVEGSTNLKDITDFLKVLPVKDSYFIRQKYNEIMPELLLTFKYDEEDIKLPVDYLRFFWPESV